MLCYIQRFAAIRWRLLNFLSLLSVQLRKKPSKPFIWKASETTSILTRKQIANLTCHYGLHQGTGLFLQRIFENHLQTRCPFIVPLIRMLRIGHAVPKRQNVTRCDCGKIVICLWVILYEDTEHFSNFTFYFDDIFHFITNLSELLIDMGSCSLPLFGQKSREDSANVLLLEGKTILLQRWFHTWHSCNLFATNNPVLM